MAKKSSAVTARPSFNYTNNENINTKPEMVQSFWQVLSKMDPEGTVFVNDVGVIGFEGQIPSGRGPKDLSLTKDEIDLVRPFAIPDALEVDADGNIVPESVVGVLLTVYQVVEAAYYAGYEEGKLSAENDVTDALADSLEDGDEDFSEEEDESFDDSDDDDSDDDDDDDDMDVVEEDDEEEYDEEDE